MDPARLERRFLTKDGRPALVRPVRPGDEPGLAVSRREVIAARTGMTRDADDAEDSPDQCALRMREDLHLFDKNGACHLVALVEGEIAGSGVIRRQPRRRTMHVGHIGLGIRPAYQGIGLGRALMEGLIEWSRALPRGAVTRIDLCVLADNSRAIALYESLGFEVEGRRRAAVRYEDGTYVDDLWMARLL
jgi:putative acetyltransferase